MPFGLENPKDTIILDFMTEEYVDAHQQLIDNGIPKAQASTVLANLWTQANKKDKAHWAERVAREALAEEEEHEAQHQREIDKEDAKILQEEHCKNKGKFAPVKHIKVPLKPIILPSQNALHKLKAGNFCELWYFTNDGLTDAEQSGACTLDDNYLTLSQTPDRMSSFVPAIIAKDKTPVIQDENLTWEQFEQAALHMVNAMHNHKWRDDHIKMHLRFWTTLENHPWCHSHSKYSIEALLHYQGQQRCHWHQLIATPKVFSLAHQQTEMSCAELDSSTERSKLDSCSQRETCCGALHSSPQFEAVLVQYLSGSFFF
ncbi:hypothetical protein PAXRUDRAFT_147278 [Paxillus rubicundulus Ve08.2h10]|uniref:Uncharacterized protein n=1 Tax=Paxillus rubicundulus Ve08.2h10 TaxID=930991 RepID=A0A0D0D6N9_9AGAM|nr:hypothetical protein PAXRUDRAFT_147278 [Paxillus rubicundulus Ve08.2h10]